MINEDAGYIIKDPSWDDEGWTRVPNEIVRDRVLTLDAKGLILVLASHATSYKIRLEPLRLQVGVGREKLRKLLRELETAGYLEREATYQVINGRNRRGPNRYTLTRSRLQKPASEVPQSEVPENRAHELTSENAVELPGFEAPGAEAPGNSPSIKKTIPKKTKKDPGAASASPRGHRLPDDFEVTPEMVAWCRKNFPTLDGKSETAKFRDYWAAKAGAAARKVDWTRTWQVWMRTAAERQPTRRGARVYTSANGAQIERY